MSSEEVARVLGVSAATVRRWVQQKKLIALNQPGLRAARVKALRFDRQYIEDWAAQG